MGLATSRQEAFWEACGFGHLEKAKFLLEAGDIDVNWVSYTNDCCPIHTASQGKKEIVELLLQHNCDVNTRDNRGNLALHHAAMKGHADICKMLLDAGSEIDAQEKNGWTALHNAAYWCHPEVVKLLIDRGCNIHLQNKDERTALHECARSQQQDDHKLAQIASMLIKAGSDINAKSSDFGEADLTGLMYAAYHNHPEVASVLVEAGCELDAIGTTFWTALHWAADRSNEEIVYILLDAGANPTKRCLKGETAFDRANSETIKEILSTAMQLYKDLHRISITERLPAISRAKPETYKPMCDASFKSQSFLPGNWKASSNMNVKNLINEKKARLAAITKQQYRNELARRTGSSTVITDDYKTLDDKPNDTNDIDSKVADSGSNKEVDEDVASIKEADKDICNKEAVKDTASNKEAEGDTSSNSSGADLHTTDEKEISGNEDENVANVLEYTETDEEEIRKQNHDDNKEIEVSDNSVIALKQMQAETADDNLETENDNSCKNESTENADEAELTEDPTSLEVTDQILDFKQKDEPVCECDTLNEAISKQFDGCSLENKDTVEGNNEVTINGDKSDCKEVIDTVQKQTIGDDGNSNEINVINGENKENASE